MKTIREDISDIILFRRNPAAAGEDEGSNKNDN